VRGMWLMLQQDRPDDYVLATGRAATVREFVTRAFAHVGYQVDWCGTGLHERGVCSRTGKVLVEIDPRYIRPPEVDLLLGDPSKGKPKLGWEPIASWEGVCEEMGAADLQMAATWQHHHVH